MALVHRRKASSVSVTNSKNVKYTVNTFKALSSPKTGRSRIEKRRSPLKISPTKDREALRSLNTSPVKSIDSSSTTPLRNQEILDVYCWGTGSMCELGLGPDPNCKVVKRPRLNRFLSGANVKIVDIAAGGMHACAIDINGKIYTWGVNDQGALGRPTQWTCNMEASGSDSEIESLNPLESTPTIVEDLNAKVVQAACSDSLTAILDERGLVYSWGTFRCSQGILGYSLDHIVAYSPERVQGISDIVALVTGVDHVLALTSLGRVYSWGNGQQFQLGRRVVERTKHNGLVPREFGLKNIKIIGSGSYHSFAINARGKVYAWGLNQYGQCGIPALGGKDGAVVTVPTEIRELQDLNIVQICGGEHHSCAMTSDGDLYVWGRLDVCELGIPRDQLPSNVVCDQSGNPRFLPLPHKVENIPKIARIAAGTHHNIAISKEDGSLWSWGFGESFQTGHGMPGDDVEAPTKIENTATRDVKMKFVAAGGQFSIAAGYPKVN